MFHGLFLLVVLSSPTRLPLSDSSTICLFVSYRYTHTSRSTGDNAHRRFDGTCIEVRHLLLRDLAKLRLRQRTDFCLVRHTGTGLTSVPMGKDGTPLLSANLVENGFFVPETLEEQLVCYADKFYSKSSPDRVLSVLETAQSLEKFGHEGVIKFLHWAELFEG